VSFRERVHGRNRRWHVFTGNARRQGLAVSHDAARSDAKDPRERDQRECKSLSRLNQARLCSGSFGVCAIEGTLDANNVFVCGCWTHGVYAHTRGGGAWTNCGTYGNAWYGLAVESNAVFTSSAIQSQMNGQYGLYANSGGVLWLAGSLATGNATLDAYAAGNGIINANQSSSLGTSSPPANSGPGNNGGVVLLS